VAPTGGNARLRPLRQTWRLGEFVALYGCLPAILLVTQPGRWAQLGVWAVVAGTIALLGWAFRTAPSNVGLGTSGRKHLLPCVAWGLLGIAALLPIWWAVRTALARSVWDVPDYPPAAWVTWVLLAAASAVIDEFVFRAVLLRRYAAVLPTSAIVPISAAASGWAALAVNRWDFALALGLGGLVAAFAYRRHPSLPGAVIVHVSFVLALATIGYAAPAYRPW
jgi:hypothetical protein